MYRTKMLPGMFIEFISYGERILDGMGRGTLEA